MLRRPYGGWGARAWRRDVLAWLEAAFWFLASAAFCERLYALCGVVVGLAG